MSEYVDWIVGITTLISIELMVRKHYAAWWTGLLNQLVWSWYIYETQEYGLIPMNIALYIQNARGLLAWSKTKESSNAPHDRLSDTTDSS